MAQVLIAAPVLGRPQSAPRLAESAREGTTVPYTLLFLCSPGDTAQIASCERTGASVLVVPWEPGPADYSRKVNYAVQQTVEPWILMGADDICFCPQWAENALCTAEHTGAQVIGTQDWGNSRVIAGTHSTHPLVSRAYIEEHGTIDQPGLMLHEGYDHNFVDDELVETAKARGVWAFCAESELPHHHPDWGSNAWDATYTKGRARFSEDAALYYERRRLWDGH